MKKYINKFGLALLFVCIFFVFPSKMGALDINSDYYKYNETFHSIKLKNIDASFDFFVGSQNYNGSERVYISGSFNNPNYLNDKIYTKTFFFDSNKNVIATCDSEDSLLGKGYSAVAFYCGIDEQNFINNKSIDDIMYYKMLISVNIPISVEDENHYDDNRNVYVDDSKKDLTNDYSNYNDNLQYILNSYDINIIVNENNTLNITEKIGAYFNIRKHGIFRKIPLKNEVKRLDGTISKNRAQISDIKVNNNYSLSIESGYKVIKIGEANYTLIGQKDYEISYLYNLGRDTGKGYDELYFNIIGNEWDTSISNITFTITMPKEFDSSKLGFSSGTVGSTDSSKIAYTVNGNIISGKYNGTLAPKEALTVRLELPEGYFVNSGINMPTVYYLMFIVPAISLLISFILWKKYGKDERVIKTIEFYPPQGLNSLEVAYLYKGYVECSDANSLLVYLANKGYIKITEMEEDSLHSDKKSFIITKIKEYDGSNINEKIFLKGLFKKSQHVDLDKVNEIMNQARLNGKEMNYQQAIKLSIDETKEQSVTKDNLYNKFYKTIIQILDNINKEGEKRPIFEKNTNLRAFFIMLFIIATLVTIILIPTLQYAETGEVGSTLFCCLFLAPFFAIQIFAGLPIDAKIIVIIINLVQSCVILSGLPIARAVVDDYHYIIGISFGIICVFIMILLFKAMPKRTKYGNEMLGKIEGFKKFLKTAEKQKLEAMVMENPTYFYDILPFTYVLGISNKWIKKFEAISLQAPDWYDGCSSFDTKSFGSFIVSTMSSVSNSSSSSSSSSSSGGGSSSGGSSGGGSGGGGGGSW